MEAKYESLKTQHRSCSRSNALEVWHGNTATAVKLDYVVIFDDDDDDDDDDDGM